MFCPILDQYRPFLRQKSGKSCFFEISWPLFTKAAGIFLILKIWHNIIPTMQQFDTNFKVSGRNKCLLLSKTIIHYLADSGVYQPINLIKFFTLVQVSNNGCQISPLSAIHLQRRCSRKWFSSYFILFPRLPEGSKFCSQKQFFHVSSHFPTARKDL